MSRDLLKDINIGTDNEIDKLKLQIELKKLEFEILQIQQPKAEKPTLPLTCTPMNNNHQHLGNYNDHKNKFDKRGLKNMGILSETNPITGVRLLNGLVL